MHAHTRTHAYTHALTHMYIERVYCSGSILCFAVYVVENKLAIIFLNRNIRYFIQKCE